MILNNLPFTVPLVCFSTLRDFKVTTHGNTTLCRPILFTLFFKRFMMCYARTAMRFDTSLTKPMLTSYSGRLRTYPSRINYHERSVLQQPYAIRSVNKADNTPTDPKSFHNNPPIGKKKIRHYEIHRERCDELGCNGKICIGLCSNFKDRKAVAHGTHGKSLPHETDRVTVRGSQKDFNGDPKPQNYVFYKDAHDANPTLEHIQGTQQINNDPNIMQTIITHEDKK